MILIHKINNNGTYCLHNMLSAPNLESHQR